MPPKKRVAATKLRWAKWREEPAEEEPDDEPEVELEEPEEEPTELEPFPWSWNEWFQLRIRQRVFDAFLEWKYGCDAFWKIDKEAAERKAVQEAKEKAWLEEEEKRRLLHVEKLREIHEVYDLREQQQRAACANGCVCVCAYGFSRKRHLSAMGSPLVSRNVSTFNANV